ncbi:MAG: hypothetical protein IPJ19_15785 [Planctomycetes bacterium]|nr:hypothetical protein [Planctomycetota bacterium]
MHTTDPHGAASGPGHELTDAKIRPLAESGLVLIVLCLASFGSMIWVYKFLRTREQQQSAVGNALTPLREVPPGPLLETAPHMPVNFSEAPNVEKPIFKSTGLADVRAYEAQKLDTYYWIDEQSKVVHIPIQQAMQKLLEQGLPTRK